MQLLWKLMQLGPLRFFVELKKERDSGGGAGVTPASGFVSPLIAAPPSIRNVAAQGCKHRHLRDGSGFIVPTRMGSRFLGRLEPLARCRDESFIGIVSPENKDSGPLHHLLPIDFLVIKQTSWSCVKPGAGKFCQFAIVRFRKL